MFKSEYTSLDRDHISNIDREPKHQLLKGRLECKVNMSKPIMKLK